METTTDKIKVTQLKLQLEKDPMKKQELQKQLNILNLEKEIEQIKHRIKQISGTA